MRTRHFPKKIKAGFTLLELLVVVAILASLGAIVFTAGKRVLTSARIAQSTTNLRSLATANAGYQNDYGVFCPADDQFNMRRWHGARRSAKAGFDARKGFLAPYLGESESIGVCPLFKALVGENSFENGTGGYGYNAAYIGGLPGGNFDRDTKLRISERMANLDDPARTIMFATTAYARADGLQEYPYCEPPFWDFGDGPAGMRPSPSLHFRANGNALVAWCDGHVSSEKPRKSPVGTNPHGGDAEKWNLGWFGPEAENGFWNSRKNR